MNQEGSARPIHGIHEQGGHCLVHASRVCDIKRSSNIKCKCGSHIHVEERSTWGVCTRDIVNGGKR